MRPASRTSSPRLPLLSVLAFAGALGAQPPDRVVARVLAGAERQVGVTVIYDGTYRRLAYPGGDVPAERGVCTDVVVRAYRHAGIDLQVLVHEDMTRAFGAYPRAWGLSRPDRSIDHRRVPNLATFFARHGDVLPIPKEASGFAPGDVVTFRLPSGLPHIGLVSARVEDGRPLVVHNVGAGTVFEDVLSTYAVTGRYRYPRGAGAASGRGAPGPARTGGSRLPAREGSAATGRPPPSRPAALLRATLAPAGRPGR